MKFVVIEKSEEKLVRAIYPSPSRDRVRVSRKFKKNQSDLHRWKKRGGEKEGSIELWNRKCCIPSKEYQDRMISVFEVTLENWKPIFKLESLTFRQLLYLHFHSLLPLLLPRGDESKSFQTSSQAYRLPSSSSIRWEAAVSGLEFTGNNIVARRWPRNECTCHDKVSSSLRRLHATFKLLKPV